jgi:uncharacterized protein YxjI
MDELTQTSGLVVRQKKEWGEILTGFETRNSYAVMDASGRELAAAAEVGGSTLALWFLKSMRPFEIYVRSFDGQNLLHAVRPFRFYFHAIEVFGSRGELLGRVQRRFSIIRRKYAVRAASGREYELFGPLFHPWTFEIREGESVVGTITKKWSGLMKEAFTDADNFGVTFPAAWDVGLKLLFLGAVFLIDFVHFENTGNR